MKITLLGSPKSTNHIYKSHCKFGYPQYYMTKEGNDIKETYQIEMLAQRGKWRPSTDILAIKLDFYFGDKRKNDIDNFNKLIFDAGNKILWEDDTCIHQLSINKNYDKKNPRVELEII